MTSQSSFDGYLRIVDRIKDMIIVSGFNVYPNELEDVCVRLGYSSVPLWVRAKPAGEALCSVVKTDEALSEEAIISFMREQVTGYKVPKTVIFKDELPKTNVGKILRRELRDEAQQSLAAA